LAAKNDNTAPGSVTFKNRIEYVAVRAMVAFIGTMPRALARSFGAALGGLAWRLLGRLRDTGERNLELAYPNISSPERAELLRNVYRSLGWQLAEFCQMSGYTASQANALIRYEGLGNYLDARAKGRGVLVLTGHLGAWELSSFFHSLVGYPMSLVIRRLDNPLVDKYVNGIRCLHGNRIIHKDDFARGLLTAMHNGETVGILMDTNMTPPQGVFVPFFGTEACTATAMARIALKSNAAVLPGFLLWHEEESRYVLHFGPEIELMRSEDAQADVLANTAQFAAVTEQWIRRFPGQWLWVHRRWKTRPEGEAKLYS
jgi:KDO2-lipid IV(A) lauroyltransferase